MTASVAPSIASPESHDMTPKPFTPKTPHRARLAAAAMAVLLAGWAQALPAQAQTAVGTGLKEIGDLGRLNGTALACQDLTAARRAKALMLKHAPKTERYGTRFDEATQDGFRAMTAQQTPCPTDPSALQTRLDAVEQQLQVALPATAGQP
jgi:hypothetical protein